MPPTPLSDAQDEAIERMTHLIIRDTGRGMVTPTIIYSMGTDRVRVVPGGIDERQFLDIARVAT
jgi:thioredoxin-related protein